MESIEDLYNKSKEIFLSQDLYDKLKIDFNIFGSCRKIRSPLDSYNKIMKLIETKIRKNSKNKRLFLQIIYDDITFGSYYGLLIFKIYYLHKYFKDLININEFIDNAYGGYPLCPHKSRYMIILNEILKDYRINEMTTTMTQQNVYIRKLFNLVFNLEAKIQNLESMNINLLNEISSLKTHIEYAPNGSGYIEAQNHFNDCLNKLEQ